MDDKDLPGMTVYSGPIETRLEGPYTVVSVDGEVIIKMHPNSGYELARKLIATYQEWISGRRDAKP